MHDKTSLIHYEIATFGLYELLHYITSHKLLVLGERFFHSSGHFIEQIFGYTHRCKMSH